MAKAMHVTGLSFDLTNKSAIDNRVQIISMEDSTTPFLGAFAKGRRVWQIDLSHAKSATETDLASDWTREVETTAFIDSATGHLLKVICDIKPLDPLLDHEMNAQEAEGQLRQKKEEYVGFPQDSMIVDFVSAANACRYHPMSARQAIGQYVMLRQGEGKPHPMWVITLRGITPIKAKGGSVDWIPEYARNTIRQVVNGKTGKIRYATSFPGPGLTPEDRARLFPWQDTTKD